MKERAVSPDRNEERDRSPWSLRDAASDGQFELTRDGEVVGWMRYRHSAPNRYFLLHTEVVQSLRGEGTGRTVIEAVLREIRSRHGKVTAICPYVVDYLTQNNTYGDLIDLRTADD